MKNQIKNPIKKPRGKKKLFIATSKAFFWFVTGAMLATFLLTSFTFIIFEKINSGVVYPGISVENIDVGKYTQKNVERVFLKKNEALDAQFTFRLDDFVATISAKDLGFGYDENLIAKQTIALGRSDNFLSNISIVFQAYFDGINLSPAYHYSEEKLFKTLAPFIEKANKDPIDALFSFQDGKVITFKPSEEGRQIDIEEIKKDLNSQFEKIKQQPKNIIIPISVKVLQPKITTDKANNLGIKELIAKGESLFQHSIPSRVFNLTLAASRINGILIAPNETFSFVKALGDVSAFTGYQKAYVIQNGKTVLGDGGGICQVSTTFFRALLYAGLPIVERRAHAYRVGYYEQDSPPGLDATVFVPSVDLKFKNDTNNYILIQTEVDPDIQQLLVFLYGTKDNRSVQLTNPVITNRTPAPADLYQEDPTLQKGIIKQVDFKADGATVSFTREVTRDGKKVITEKFVSNYAPWQSVFLRGTKE